jgi:hypothetical protein
LIEAVKELNVKTKPLYQGISVDSGFSSPVPFLNVDTAGNVSVGDMSQIAVSTT